MTVGKHKLTTKQKCELKRLYKDGARDVDLADWFGINEATVRGHTKGIRRANPQRTFDYAKAAKLREQYGMNYTAIALRLGVAKGQTVKRAIDRHMRAAA